MIRSRRYRAILDCIGVLGVLILLSTAARAEIDGYFYQVPMRPAPTSVSDAIASLPERRTGVITAMACGSELSFVPLFRQQSNSEDIAGAILGKLAWLQSGGNINLQPCLATVAVQHWQACKLFDDKCLSEDEGERIAAQTAFLANPAWTALFQWPSATQYMPDTTPIRARILSLLPQECQDSDGQQNYSIAASSPFRDRPAHVMTTPVRLMFRISAACLAAQANQALQQMSRGDMQVGTTGMQCHYFGSTKGDWDATLKDLIRIAELDRRTSVLRPETRRHLNDDLIDIDGGPAQESYALWECGNEERSVGDPQTRSDDREGVDRMAEDLWDSGWDMLSILLLLLILVAVAGAVLVLIAAAGTLAVAAVAVVVAAIVAGLLLIRIPETENHLWMINSTKYLNNQYIITHGGTGYWSDQNDLREWILQQMQKILQTDFLEYNSRPYQRYSLVAIANLADFAEDPDVKTGARMVLEYAVSKYAVSSSEGRRIVPYRRKREYLRFVDGEGTSRNGLFDLLEGSDHIHALGLYYFGASLNLPRFDDHAYAASLGYAAQAIYYATSDYRPDETAYSLAIDRAPLMHQRLHHHGYEIVSRGLSFTITAGGLTTGMAKNVISDGIDQLIKADDLGAAVPTTLMLTGPPDLPATLTQPAIERPIEARRSSLDRFLRFDGKRPDAGDARSYDRNLCVWDGFACGVNMVIPEDIRNRCMKPGHRQDWFLVRSDDPDCPAYNAGPPFWMVLYVESHPGRGEVSGFGPVASGGFLEIIDGGEMPFEEFRRRVALRNLGPGVPMDVGVGCGGAYVSARGPTGQRIEFSCERVTKVDAAVQSDPADWGHAGAPPGALGYAPIQSSGSGKVEITSLAARRKVTLDFGLREDPHFGTVTLP